MTRSCGTCSRCCKLLNVFEGELQKSRGQWCPHCFKDKGCGIYDARPSVCRKYQCLWLADAALPDELWPKQSHVVLGYNSDRTVLYAEVDPATPLVWQREPTLTHLRLLSRRLLLQNKPVPLIVRAGIRLWCLVPNKAVSIASERLCSVKRIGLGQWEVIQHHALRQAS